MTDKAKTTARELDEKELDQANGGYTVTFTDLIVSSYQTGGSHGDDVAPGGAKFALGDGSVRKG